MTPETMDNPQGICAVDGCDRRKRSRGWCSSHYNHWHTTREVPTRAYSVEARFNSYVMRAGEDECWPWGGTRTLQGYGQIGIDNKLVRAHRISYEIAKGKIPDGLIIRHTCDNPPCVNPNHLLAGTHKDNARDAVERGRNPRGERQGPAKLTATLVTDIRFSRANGESVRSLAARCGVSQSTIRRVIYGRSWVGIGEYP